MYMEFSLCAPTEYRVEHDIWIQVLLQKRDLLFLIALSYQYPIKFNTDIPPPYYVQDTLT
jgi:hypothetical protein